MVNCMLAIIVVHIAVQEIENTLHVVKGCIDIHCTRVQLFAIIIKVLLEVH